MTSSKYTYIVAALLIACFAAAIYPSGGNGLLTGTDKSAVYDVTAGEVISQAPDTSYEVEISGKLRMVGSAPFYEFVITTADNVDYYLEAKKEELERLRTYQGRSAKTTGIVKIQQIKYPNSAYDHERRSIFPKTLDIK